MKPYRETTIRINGVVQTIRTDLKSTVKRMEADHTKAVKAALEAVHRAQVDAQHAEIVNHLATADYPDPEGWGVNGVGMGEYRRARDIADEEARYAKLPKTRFAFPRVTYVDARMGFPKVKFTSEVPTYLIEIAPGEYVTSEAQEGQS